MIFIIYPLSFEEKCWMEGFTNIKIENTKVNLAKFPE